MSMTDKATYKKSLELDPINGATDPINSSLDPISWRLSEKCTMPPHKIMTPIETIGKVGLAQLRGGAIWQATLAKSVICGEFLQASKGFRKELEEDGV